MEFYAAAQDQCVYIERNDFLDAESSLYSLPDDYMVERGGESGVVFAMDSIEEAADSLDVSLADRVNTEINRFSGQLRLILEQQSTEYRQLLQSASNPKVIVGDSLIDNITSLEYDGVSTMCDCCSLSTQCPPHSLADGRTYDLHDSSSRAAVQVGQQEEAALARQYSEEDSEEAETWKSIVRMFVASGIVEKTLREAGLPEFT